VRLRHGLLGGRCCSSPPELPGTSNARLAEMSAPPKPLGHVSAKLELSRVSVHTALRFGPVPKEDDTRWETSVPP